MKLQQDNTGKENMVPATENAFISTGTDQNPVPPLPLRANKLPCVLSLLKTPSITSFTTRVNDSHTALHPHSGRGT